MNVVTTFLEKEKGSKMEPLSLWLVTYELLIKILLISQVRIILPDLPG